MPYQSYGAHSAVLFTHRRTIVGFLAFLKVLTLCEMQIVSSKKSIWFAVSISHDDNHYTTSVSFSKDNIHCIARESEYCWYSSYFGICACIDFYMGSFTEIRLYYLCTVNTFFILDQMHDVLYMWPQLVY